MYLHSIDNKLQVAKTYLRMVKKAYFDHSHAWAPFICVINPVVEIYNNFVLQCMSRIDELAKA